jgi:hypothetical protein
MIAQTAPSATAPNVPQTMAGSSVVPGCHRKPIDPQNTPSHSRLLERGADLHRVQLFLDHARISTSSRSLKPELASLMNARAVGARSRQTMMRRRHRDSCPCRSIARCRPSCCRCRRRRSWCRQTIGNISRGGVNGRTLIGRPGLARTASPGAHSFTHPAPALASAPDDNRAALRLPNE